MTNGFAKYPELAVRYKKYSIQSYLGEKIKRSVHYYI